MKNLIICNACGDEKIAPISMYLLNKKRETVIAGVLAEAKEKEADIMFFLPENKRDEDLEHALAACAKDVQIVYGTESLVTINPFAILQELKGNLPRPTIMDDAVPMWEDKVVSLITPEAAYEKAAQTQVKFIYVNQKDVQEVKEVKIGSKLADAVSVSGAKGILLGGLRGSFVSEKEFAEKVVTTDCEFDSVTLYGPETCMVRATADLMKEAWDTSCGKCVLCREGSLQFKTITEEMTTGKAKATDVELLKEVGELIEIGAYCAYGKRMPKPLISALILFADEFEAHIKKKSCPAGVCYQAEAVYVILPKDCIGCGDCIDACDEDAIIGKKKFIHMIDEDMCENCGNCVDACDEGAIVKVTGAKPKLPKKLTKVGKF